MQWHVAWLQFACNYDLLAEQVPQSTVRKIERVRKECTQRMAVEYLYSLRGQPGKARQRSAAVGPG